jgi:thioredoxin
METEPDRVPRPIVLEATEETFDSLVMKSPVPVLVDLWAPWCGPCRLVAPGLREIARSFVGRARVVKVNIDQNRSFTRRLGVHGIPAVVLVDRGTVLGTTVGVRPKQEYERLLDRVLQQRENPAF